VTLVLLAAALFAAPAPPAAGQTRALRPQLAAPGGQFTGDLDAMVQRRLIRVILPYSKTSYFIDKGVQRGIAYDFFRLFEEYVNGQLKTGSRHIEVLFIPTSRDQLGDALFSGKGDIAAGNLTITDARRELADFSEPVTDNVREVVVTGPGAPPVSMLEDLAGTTMHVRTGSLYEEHLKELSDEFTRNGRKPIRIKTLPSNLEDEDILEMANAGLIKMTVVDDHIADFWKQVLPKLSVKSGAVVRSDLSVGYAMRKNSPKLKAMLDGFIRTHRRRTMIGNMLLARYLKNTKYVKDATSTAEMKKFERLVELFRRYGEQYGLDWVLMAAHGYQESGLDQGARSRVGAIGVMQVMPQTGREMNVGDIRQVGPNIHAGIKYIRIMIDQYFKTEPMDDLNKTLFAFAAYNMGPGRVEQLRREAERVGLDPNLWFGNVERVAAGRVGPEPVTHVSNIYKYYIAYRLSLDELKERQSQNRNRDRGASAIFMHALAELAWRSINGA
jgi:membrane-bound lytic murein transglycosylase MltF